MRMAIPAAVFAMLLAPLVAIDRAAAAIDTNAKCEEVAADSKRQLLAAAAAALDPRDEWDEAQRVCVRYSGKTASLSLVTVESPELRMQHSVDCSRRNASDTWVCRKQRSDFLLQVNGREIVVDPRISVADARKITTFFANYSGPDFMLPACGEDSRSRVPAKMFARMERIYIDLDMGLTLSLASRRITLDQSALLETGEVKPVCWFHVVA